MANPSLGAGGRVGERGAWNVGADFFHARNNYPFLVDNGLATHRERRTNSLMNAGTGEAAFSFAYILRSHKDAKQVLFSITITPKDYEKSLMPIKP